MQVNLLVASALLFDPFWFKQEELGLKHIDMCLSVVDAVLYRPHGKSCCWSSLQR